MAGPPEGNQNGVKLKDPDLRQRAYDQYCKWLARGKSWKTFTFIEKDSNGGLIMCTGRTIESYLKEFPLEFPSIKKEIAFAQGYAHWEGVVDGSADGSNKDACTPSLNMLMRNKYDWDKETKESITSPKEFDQTLEIVKPNTPNPT